MVSGFLLAGITRFSLAQDSTSFKISGYILDSNGHGVAGAMIIFNVPQIVPAVYSDSSGYYFVSAPAGTYKLSVTPRSGYNHFTSYFEYNFVVNSNLAKNIIVSGH